MKIKLHYEEKGTGQPMVLLHGNGEDSSYFKNQIEYFSKKYRVIAVDTRGHGKSERGTAPFTLRQFARDLKSFLDEMGLRRIILLGFSDGGNIALIFTILHPQYVDRLLLNGANLNPWGMKAGVFKNIYLAYWKACLRIAKGERKKHKTEDDRYLLEKARKKRNLWADDKGTAHQARIPENHEKASAGDCRNKGYDPHRPHEENSPSHTWKPSVPVKRNPLYRF